MKKIIRLLVLMSVVIYVCQTSATAQTSQTENPAEQRAKELAQVVSTGNRASFRKYITENFSPKLLNTPLEVHLSVFSRLYDNSRGLEFHSLQDSRPNQVTALTKNNLTGGWVAFTVSVETMAPYRVDTLRLSLAKSPVTAKKKLSDQEVENELKAFVQKLADADVFSGAVLLAKDGVPVYQAAFGQANKDFNVPNRIDTKFNLGSMNKMFTAIAIAQLVERGKISFEDPLSNFLPDFPDKDSAQKIKIKHLLSHTAGLGGYFSEKFLNSSRSLYRTVDDMMKLAVADEKLLFEPGTRWQYSNTGMLVLGKIIEKVSGQSYYDYVRENIYKPAGMLNTDSYELDKVNQNLAIGYQKQFTDNGTVFSNNIFDHVMRGGPQGGGYSTVEDLLKFERALRQNKLLKEETVKLLMAAKPELSSPNYGYGFIVDKDLQTAGHSGGFPGISSNLDMFLGTGWTAIVLSNYSSAGGIVSEKMRELIISTR